MLQEGEEEIGSLTEGDVHVGHDQIDRVEVFLTAEAPCEIGVGVGGGVELEAEGAEEAKEALGDLVGDHEHLGDYEVDGDVVTELEECMPGETLGHGEVLSQGSLK